MKSLGNFKTQSAGFSLIEILMVVFISGFTLLVIGSQMLGAYKSQISAQSKSQLIQEVQTLSRQIANNKSLGTGTCAAMINLNTAENTVFNPTGPTEIEIIPDPTQPALIFKKGHMVNQGTGTTPFVINQLQLTDTVLIATEGLTKTYVSNLMLTASTGSMGAMINQRPRQIATITVITGASGNIDGCNMNPEFSDAKGFCDGIEGKVWNPVDMKCQQDFAVDNVSLRFDCPPGMQGTPGACKPISSMCASGQLARGYHRAQVANCEVSPAGPTKGPARAPVSLTIAEGGPLPSIPAAPTMPAYVPPAANSTLPAPSAPATPPPACVNGTHVGEQTGQICYSGFALDPYMGYVGEYCVPDPAASVPTAANANCVGTGTSGYNSPNLAVTPPSPAPPADNSCQCNNRRIAHGEDCMYCIENVDLGYGYVDYAYGVSTCTNGNLIPVANPQVNVGPTYACGNTYGRARRVGPRFEMYNEIP